MSVETSSLDLSYLTARTNDLKEECCIMVLMVDEVSTAQRIEYSYGNFVGLTVEGKQAKTVLTFMIQSVSHKYKNVVCLLLLNQLDTEFLKNGLIKSWLLLMIYFMWLRSWLTIMFATGMPHACYYLIDVTCKVIS